jgi:pyrroline-5-carboxylate reductase
MYRLCKRVAQVEYEKATVGFIGIGTINSAVCRGLLKSAASPAKVIIGPRNAEKAAALAAEYPDKVTVAKSNQDVVDASDWVFLGTPPKKDITQQTLSALKFRKGQPILSFVAGIEREDLEKLVAPATDIVQALPLPPAEFAESTTVMFPPNQKIERCLSNLGRVVSVESREQAMAIGSMACIMGDFYAHLRACHQWLISKDIDSATASKAVSSYFSTYHHASQDSDIGFDHLVAEQTPGGVNQQVIEELEKQGRYDAVKDGLEIAFKRLCPLAVPLAKEGPMESNAAFSHELLPLFAKRSSLFQFPMESFQLPEEDSDEARNTNFTKGSLGGFEGMQGFGMPGLDQPMQPKRFAKPSGSRELKPGTLVQIRDAEAVHAASRDCGIASDYDELRARAVGSIGKVFRIDKSDRTAKVEVEGLGPIWFGAAALQPVQVTSETFSSPPAKTPQMLIQ